MARQNLAPAAEEESILESSTAHVIPDADLSDRVIKDMAGRFILAGPNSLTLSELDTVQVTLKSRMNRAVASGLSPKDVIVSFLRPALSQEGHCRCPSCRQTCAVCGATGTED